MIGNTVTANMGGQLYTEFFAPDGRYVEMSTEGTVKGAWSFQNNRLCTIADGEMHCWQVILNGSTVTWVNDQGENDGVGNVVPGNPFNL
ncbi:hypothetical protein CCP2SC5_120022 [Azospirillaceae bacterium]